MARVDRDDLAGGVMKELDARLRCCDALFSRKVENSNLKVLSLVAVQCE